MALIGCPECSTQVSDKAISCPSCGCPISAPPHASQLVAAPPVVTVSKSRGTYIILAIIFGAFGFHNFYSGHNVPGGIKVGLFLLALILDASTGFYSAFSLVLLVLFELWALVEAFVVTTDARGNQMS
jgi:TM2 domain-containing membrane protein YozV